MKVFDLFKKKNMALENAPGLQAIVEECGKLYSSIKKVKTIKSENQLKNGGQDPLDYIKIYDGGEYWHFITCGLSELYEKKTANPTISGYGFEISFKLKKSSNYKKEEEFKRVASILQSIARYVYSTNTIYQPNQYIYTGQTEGFSAASLITGFITMEDSDLKTINTVNGQIQFIEIIGATNNELLSIINGKMKPIDLYTRLETDITDYYRDSFI